MTPEHKAVFDNYPTVVTIIDKTAYDKNEQIVKIDWEMLNDQIESNINDFNLNILRNARDNLLIKCDWTQSLDSPLSEERKEAWQIYRQALRDITEHYSSLEEVVWPEKPES